MVLFIRFAVTVVVMARIITTQAAPTIKSLITVRPCRIRCVTEYLTRVCLVCA